MKRRTFLGHTALAVAPLLLPVFNSPLYAAPRISKRKLIMIHLKGGNDGYNTIVPYTNKQYYQARPTLAVQADEVIKLNKNFGFNPALKSLNKHYNKGNMLVINNVSSNEIDHSHYSSTALWQQHIFQNKAEPSHHLDYGHDDFMDGVRNLALEIHKNPTEQIYHISLDGFDTHQFQKTKHDLLLKSYADGLDHLLNELEASGELANTLVVTWSEFGRQLKENTKKGTEHGDLNTLLIYGSALKTKGIWKSDALRNSAIDFRSVYSTIAQNWLHTPHNLFEKSYLPMNWI